MNVIVRTDQENGPSEVTYIEWPDGQPLPIIGDSLVIDQDYTLCRVEDRRFSRYPTGWQIMLVVRAV